MRLPASRHLRLWPAWLRFAAFWAVAASVSAGGEGGGWGLGPAAVCFPPAVPASGEKIAATAPPARERTALAAPVELADYVNESFYPALSTRLLAGALPSRMEHRLEAYRAARTTLVNQLADQLVSLHGMDDVSRANQLRAFAAEQEPRILALEREGEELRQFLVDGGLLYATVDWSRRREWVLGVTRFRNEPIEKEAQFQVVRAAAFYQPGLVAEQRGLLLELAAELQERARAARAIASSRSNDPTAMYFAPATSRLRLPKNATPELVALIGRFNREKSALKQELREAVFAHDKASRADRTAAFEALADEQWPRLAALDELAEEIRVAISALPAERLAAPPYIPPGLMRRIEDYQNDRQRFVEEFEQAIQVATNLVQPPRVDFRLPVDSRVQAARRWAEDRAALRAKVAAAFQEATRERFQAMRARYDAIQVDLALVADGQADRETGRPLTPETLLRGYSDAMERFDTFGREEVIYRGYRIAMLMTGLAPAQRRLLFGAALVGLAQALPFSELAAHGLQPQPRS